MHSFFLEKMMIISKKFRLFLMIAYLVTGTAIGAEILTFEFVGLLGDEVTAASNTNDANLSSSTISRGTLTATAAADAFAAKDWALTSIANAVSGNKYMEFTITPNSGYQFSVTSIYLQILSSQNGPDGIAIRNSVDNYANNLDQEYSITSNNQNFTFTFTQSNSSSAVTYRVYMWAAKTNGLGGIGAAAGNDIIVNGTVLKVEPANHVSNFSGSSDYASVTLTWTDNDGTPAADGFIIKGSTVSLAAIPAPSDGTAESDDAVLSDGSGVMNVAHGVQTYTWSGLDAETTHYFQIWPYTNSGTDIDYKIDGVVPNATPTTGVRPKIIIAEIMQNPDAVSDANGEWFELYNAGASTIDIDGWIIKDGGTDDHTINNGGALNITTGDFIVLGISSAQPANGDYTCDYVYSAFTLDDAGDEIILMDGSEEIDRVEYDGGTNWPAPTGASMIFTGIATDDNNAYANWSTAADRQPSYIGVTGDKGSPGSNGNDQALPITLTSFDAIYVNGVIKLNWETASETDNALFLIYRYDEVIGTVDGAGTTSEPHAYRFTDVYVVPGRTYTYVLADISLANVEVRHDDKAVIIIAAEDGMVKDFSIGLAYPNPFNPVTIVPVNLTRDVMVCATLYDVNGRKIKGLMNNTLVAGSHTLCIDGNGLTTGMYILRVTVGNTLHVQKIVLMK